ncbi:MAG: hypothetical protein ACJ75H_04845 [Thermoanaerobaculia bacterium]
MKRQLLFALLAAFTLAPAAHAALQNAPKEDIHWMAEHLPESAQDARYLSLPWPAFPLEPGRWQLSLQPGYADTTASDIFELKGPMVAASAVRGLSGRWGFEVLGFYDTMTVSGGRGRAVLRSTAPVPLDLPALADFESAHGDYLHYGVGGALVHDVPRTGGRRYTVLLGLIADRLEITDYAVTYRLGPVVGSLDHSSSATFATPYAGVQYSRPLGSSFTLAPRFIAGAPLPPADFDVRLAGPGFDVSSANGQGSPGRIGDAFLGLGAGLIHRSGFEILLGESLYYPVFEKETHPGVDRAYMLQVAWHWR